MTCVCVFGGADLTSTSYVYSSLVGDRARRVVTCAPVDAAVADLRVRDVQVADDVPLGCDAVAHAVAAVLHYDVVVQRPCHHRLRRPFDVTRQGDEFVGAHHFLTEGRQDLGRAICQETDKYAG